MASESSRGASQALTGADATNRIYGGRLRFEPAHFLSCVFFTELVDLLTRAEAAGTPSALRVEREQTRIERLDAVAAAAEAGVTRLRPVMLTAITTILGLLPMATGVSFDFRKLAWDIGGESSQWWGPMAVAVIFGLGFATLLTLIVVPVLCSLVDRMKKGVDR